MTAKLIDGLTLANTMRQDIIEKVKEYQKARGYAPGLAVILVGDDPASHVYVKNKSKSCEEVGMQSQVLIFPENTTQKTILAKIDALNDDDRVHGILIQLPLPKSIDTPEVISRISPQKDVDGLHPQNLGLLFSGRPSFVPCTPLGCLHLIKSVVPSIKGKHAVVVGWNLVSLAVDHKLAVANAVAIPTHNCAEVSLLAGRSLGCVPLHRVVAQHHLGHEHDRAYGQQESHRREREFS